MAVSISPALASTCSVFGSFGFGTLSGSSHAIASVAHASPSASLLISHSVAPRVCGNPGCVVVGGLETIAQGQRERAEIREGVVVGAADGPGVTDTPRGTGLRIVPGIVTPGDQVPARQSHRPVAGASHGPDVVRQAHFAQLQIAGVFDRTIVRPEDVIEALRSERGRAPVVSHRLGGADVLVRLVDLFGHEIAKRPLPPLVLDLLTEGTVELGVGEDLVEVEGVGRAETVLRQRVAEIDQLRRVVGVAQQDRHPPVQCLTPWAGTSRLASIPEVLGDAFGGAVAGANPDDVPLVVPLVFLARSALASECSRQLSAICQQIPPPVCSVFQALLEPETGTARAIAAEERRHVELGDHGPRAVVVQAGGPVEIAALDDGDVE